MVGKTNVTANSLITSIIVPKDLNVTDLIFQLNTSFDFNHFTTTTTNTGETRVEVMFVKINKNSFVLNPKDKIIAFEVSSQKPGVFKNRFRRVCKNFIFRPRGARVV